MLAAVALVLGTVVLVKMQRTKYIWVTVVPAVWLLICTTWALGLKLFGAGLHGLALSFQRLDARHVQLVATGGQAGRHVL